MADQSTPEHSIIVTRHHFDQTRNRKRIHFKCPVPGCCRGHIDTVPASAANAVIALLQAEHAGTQPWNQRVYLDRSQR